MAAVVALDAWLADADALEPEGWIRARAPERRVCDGCGRLRLGWNSSCVHCFGPESAP